VEFESGFGRLVRKRGLEPLRVTRQILSSPRTEESTVQRGLYAFTFASKSGLPERCRQLQAWRGIRACAQTERIFWSLTDRTTTH